MAEEPSLSPRMSRPTFQPISAPCCRVRRRHQRRSLARLGFARGNADIPCYVSWKWQRTRAVNWRRVVDGPRAFALVRRGKGGLAADCSQLWGLSIQELFVSHDLIGK